jgi:hypothetical protein
LPRSAATAARGLQASQISVNKDTECGYNSSVPSNADSRRLLSQPNHQGIGPMAAKLTWAGLGGSVLTAAAAAAVFVAVQSLPLPVQAAQGPFSFLSGNWTGNGTIKVRSGQKERIRCKIGYSVPASGMSFDQTLKCASDSYTFDAHSSVNHGGGTINGTWSIYNLKGEVTGVAKGNKINAKVRGDGLIVSVNVTTSGNDQSVFITSQGTDVTEVSIKLKKNK